MAFLKKERSKKSDGEHKASGRKKKRRRKVNGMKCMMKYLSKVRKVDKNLSRFDLRYLDNQVFSWSVDDVFNTDLFREKVKRIPETFESSKSYFSSFFYPLIEEVHADLFSSLDGYANQNFIQVIRMEKLHVAADKIFLCFKAARPAKDDRSRETYAPSKDDILVLSLRKPKQVSDLTRNVKSYILAKIVKGGEDDDDFPPDCFIARLSSALTVEADPVTRIPEEQLFAVVLVNMKTYNRICSCLDMGKNRRKKTKMSHM